jgi:hypothetical protein
MSVINNNTATSNNSMTNNATIKTHKIGIVIIFLKLIIIFEVLPIVQHPRHRGSRSAREKYRGEQAIMLVASMRSGCIFKIILNSTALLIS